MGGRNGAAGVSGLPLIIRLQGRNKERRQSSNKGYFVFSLGQALLSLVLLFVFEIPAFSVTGQVLAYSSELPAAILA